MKKTLSIILCLILILSVFCSCKKRDGTGGNIVCPIDSFSRFLDPQIAEGSNCLTVINNCFEGLVRLGDGGEIIPGAAEKWTLSKDKKTYTFNLRSDAQWLVTKTASATYGYEDEDKKSFTLPLTANDFVFALRRAVAKNTGSKSAQTLFCIKNAEKINKGSLASSKLGVKAVGDHTLKITLNSPNSDFLTLLTTCVCMPCNEEFFNLTKGRYGLSTQYLIYNGPFFISSWTENTSVKITANEEYRGENRAKPESVYFSVNSDYSSRAEKMLDGVYDLAPLDYGQYTSIADEKGYEFLENENTTKALIFNCSKNIIKNVNLRKAIVMCFNTKSLKKNEDDRKAAGIVPPSVLFSDEYYRSKVKKISLPQYSPENAVACWKTALSELGEKSLVITIKCSEDYENDVRAIIQNMQKSFGISCDVRVSALPEEDLTSDVDSGNYQIVLADLKAQDPGCAGFLTSTAEKAGYTASDFKALTSQSSDISESQRLKNYKKAEQLLANRYVVLPIYFKTNYFGIRKGVSNVIFDSSLTVISFFNTLKK